MVAFLAVVFFEQEGSKMKVVMLGADRSVKGGVSAMVNNLYEAGISQKVNLVYIGTMVDGSSIGKLFKAGEALLKFLTVLPGADIVHLNMAADASCFRKLIFLNIASAFGKKIVVHHHGGDFEGFYEERCSAKMREKVRRSLNKADLFLVLSENWKLFFENIVSPDKIFVLENGVPIPEKAKQDYSGHQAVFLGRLCKEKGIGELLESAKRVRKAVPDFELVLGGFWEKGNEELEAKARELSDFVRCPGWVSAKERERLFAQSSVFVLPTWFEGQPVSLLEAMAAGMCTVSSAVGGIPQVLGEAENETLPCGFDGCGVMTGAKDSEMLSDVLIRVLTDEELRESIGKKARQRVEEKYGMPGYIKRLTGFYDELMKEG